MKKESKNIKTVKKTESGRKLKIAGISVFFLGIAMFFFVPFAGMTGNAISSNISEEGSFGLYLIGLALMIFGAVLAEYGQRPQEKRPDPIYAQTMRKNLYVNYKDFVKALEQAGYKTEWREDKIKVVNPSTNATILTFDIPKGGMLTRETAQTARKKILEDLVGKAEAAKLLSEKSQSR